MSRLYRAKLLLDQNRHALAEQELRQHLLEEPNHARGHALLGMSLIEQGKVAEGHAEAAAAIQADPTDEYAYYVMAYALIEQGQYADAESAVRRGLELDHEDPALFALLARVHYEQRQWQPCLTAAEEGLALDPTHCDCLNLRGMALQKLGCHREMDGTFESALAADPENPHTHANRGWTLLQQGAVDQALVHFREALRLDPTLDYAREGVAQALKSRNPLYRWSLRFDMLWSRYGKQAGWVFLLAVVLGLRWLRGLEARHPSWALEIEIVRSLFGLSFMAMFLIRPLFNLVLRFDPLGRLALAPHQLRASNWTAFCFLCATLVVTMHHLWHVPPAVWSAVVFLLLIPPLATMCEYQDQPEARAVATYVLVLCLAAVLIHLLPLLLMVCAKARFRLGVRLLWPLWRYQAFWWVFGLGCLLTDEFAEYRKRRRLRGLL